MTEIYTKSFEVLFLEGVEEVLMQWDLGKFVVKFEDWQFQMSFWLFCLHRCAIAGWTSMDVFWLLEADGRFGLSL